MIAVHPGGKIIIGDSVRLRSGFYFNPVGHSIPNAFWVGQRGHLEICDRVGLSSTTIVCQECISIGEDTYVGGGTRIFDTDFHPLMPEERRKHQPACTARISIGKQCFIGGFSTILKGVTIGPQSIIGACSVVAKSIPSGEVWAGNPAKFIRKLYNDNA
jgi:acetyltransferase-like isoleucine patch superfamily enzyme